MTKAGLLGSFAQGVCKRGMYKRRWTYRELREKDGHGRSRGVGESRLWAQAFRGASFGRRLKRVEPLNRFLLSFLCHTRQDASSKNDRPICRNNLLAWREPSAKSCGLGPSCKKPVCARTGQLAGGVWISQCLSRLRPKAICLSREDS